MRSIYRQKLNNHFLWSLLLGIFSLQYPNLAIANIHSTVLFQPPPESEQPEDTEGAASRQLGECASNDNKPKDLATFSPNFSAIVPQSNYGKTTAKRPSFWVYLPQTSAKQAILSIKQAGSSPHWQQSLLLTGKAGITGIKLSDNAPILELNQNYQWALILVCGDRPSPNDPVVAAWIERVREPNNINSEIPKLDRASAYARQGIWYDALNLLIAEKSSLDNWNDVWGSYLKSGGLNVIADQPITGILAPTIE